MKNALTRKIVTAVAALLVAASLTGCSMYAPPEEPVEDTVTSASDVSGSDVSASDVSASDVSASDVETVDDAVLADAAMNDYISALNSANVDRLVELTAAPPMERFLESIETDKEYLRASFQKTIDSMRSVSGGYKIVFEYTAADATEDELTAMKADIEALSAGSGERVQAVRIYKGVMKAYAAAMSISGSDVVSNADAAAAIDELVSAADAVMSDKVLEEAETVMRLYKYNDKWYVYGA